MFACQKSGFLKDIQPLYKEDFAAHYHLIVNYILKENNYKKYFGMIVSKYLSLSHQIKTTNLKH